MTSYLNTVDVNVDDLPSDLAYHLDLMGECVAIHTCIDACIKHT